MDSLQAAIPPIAFCLFYNKQVDEDCFRTALEKSLSSFPCLAGRLVRTGDRKQSPLQVTYHPDKGGAQLILQTRSKPYASKDDRRWFPMFTRAPFPAPSEPVFTYGPLLRIKMTHITSDNSCVISFSFCHAVMDLTSVGAFIQALSTYYTSTVNAPHTGTEGHQEEEYVPAMTTKRVFPTLEDAPQEAPLERFTTKTLVQALPKLVMASVAAKTIHLTLERSELNRLKSDFMEDLGDNASSSSPKMAWISTYEMLGTLLLRAYYLATKDKLEKNHKKTKPASNASTSVLECRCVVDPRKRRASPYTNESQQGNMGEMPSIFLPLESLSKDDIWRNECLQTFHSQLRSSLEDPQKLTTILRKAEASLQQGHLHSQQGRVMSSLLFARNIIETNVTSYNSWLHLDFFGIGTMGTVVPYHFEVGPGLQCLDMFWVFPQTPETVTVRTTLYPKTAKRFLKALTDMKIAYQLQ